MAILVGLVGGAVALFGVLVGQGWTSIRERRAALRTAAASFLGRAIVALEMTEQARLLAAPLPDFENLRAELRTSELQLRWMVRGVIPPSLDQFMAAFDDLGALVFAKADADIGYQAWVIAHDLLVGVNEELTTRVGGTRLRDRLAGRAWPPEPPPLA